MPTLSWIGKEKVVNHHLEVAVRELRRTYSFDGSGPHEADGGSENKIIHGDSLDALKALLPQYEGRVKCIYLDPPYNTGEESWVYNDNVNDPHIQKWLGDVVGKEGEDFSRHDKWLCMMYPRLKLVQKLMSDDGAVFISIDDNEQANLRMICDEIFGSGNFVANFIWEKRVNRENRKVVSSRHDYILCYARTSPDKSIKQLPMTGEALDRYQNPDNDPRGPWKSDPVTAQAGHATQSQFYELHVPCGKTYTPPSGRCWLYTEPVMMKAIEEGRIWLGADGRNTPRKKTYLNEKERGLTPESMWFSAEVSTNERAKNELKDLFPDVIPFATPKPHELIERILQIAADKKSIVLDCFAGSGTTAHAVLKRNAKDGGNRRFILVEMCDYAESVTAERVKRVIKGYGEGKNAVAGTGGDFSFYEIGEPILSGEEPNSAVRETAIRDYVWFTETRSARPQPSDTEPALLGVNFGTAYYYWHDANDPVIVNRKLLHTIKTKAESYVIYADLCALGAAELEKFHITFKKVSRDIVRI